MNVTDLKTKASATMLPTPIPARTINPRLIDAVEVVLDGFLGAARMTVAELTALKEGAVVALDAPLNGLVELRLNGAAVARGELVAVGETFAVRLTEIAP